MGQEKGNLKFKMGNFGPFLKKKITADAQTMEMTTLYTLIPLNEERNGKSLLTCTITTIYNHNDFMIET